MTHLECLLTSLHLLYDAGLINFNQIGLVFASREACDAINGGLNWRIWGQCPSRSQSLDYFTSNQGHIKGASIIFTKFLSLDVNCDLTYLIIRSTCSPSAFDISHPPLYKVNGAERAQNINIQICQTNMLV